MQRENDEGQEAGYGESVEEEVEEKVGIEVVVEVGGWGWWRGRRTEEGGGEEAG